MSFPITEKVAQAVEARLKSIQKSNGYSVNLDAARFNRQRGTLTAGTVADAYSADLHEFNEEHIENPAQGHEEWRKQFIVVVYINESESSSIPMDQRANVVVADIKKAIETDRFFDGVAVNTTFGDTSRFDADSALFGVAVEFFVHVQELETNPYSQ